MRVGVGSFADGLAGDCGEMTLGFVGTAVAGEGIARVSGDAVESASGPSPHPASKSTASILVIKLSGGFLVVSDEKITVVIWCVS